jgi:RimJ/RimL family protein N-acetyltransferase
MEVRQPVPPLADGLVTLRPWTRDDAPAIVAACADDEIARWMPIIPQPYTTADALAYIEASAMAWREGTGATFAILDDGSAPVGSIGMRVVEREHAIVEVGYWTAAPARGRGLTTRALRLISAWLLETVGARRVQLRADVFNLPSQRVAEKAGFVREGVLRGSGYNPRQGRPVDYAVYSLLPGEVE